MDYVTLFENYWNAFIEQNAKLKPKKVYRNILKELKLLVIYIYKFRIKTNLKIDDLENDKLLVENELVNNELPYYILKSTLREPPLGYENLIIKYKAKSTKIDLYFNLIHGFKIILNEYIKSNETYSSESLTTIQILLKITKDSFAEDMVQYEEQIKEMIEMMKQNQIPPLVPINNVFELKAFILKQLSQHEEYNLAAYQNETLKR